jgi:hypothetical protein
MTYGCQHLEHSLTRKLLTALKLIIQRTCTLIRHNVHRPTNGKQNSSKLKSHSNHSNHSNLAEKHAYKLQPTLMMQVEFLYITHVYLTAYVWFGEAEVKF